MYLFDTNQTKRSIFLNSKYADLYLNGTKKSSLLFYFNEIIYCPNYIDMVVKLQGCSFPLSMYNINSTNNTLYINNVAYTVPIGNYSVYQLKSTLNTLLSSAGITSTYNNITNKYTFTSTSDFTINSTSTILEQIGFSSGVSHTSTSNTLTSDNMIDLSGVSTIHFCTNLNTNNIDCYSKGKNNVLQSIPLSSVKYGIDTNDFTNSSYIKVSDKIVSYLVISIYDEDFNYIDFNNVDWSATIEFGFVLPKKYEIPENPLTDKQKEE